MNGIPSTALFLATLVILCLPGCASKSRPPPDPGPPPTPVAPAKPAIQRPEAPPQAAATDELLRQADGFVKEAVDGPERLRSLRRALRLYATVLRIDPKSTRASDAIAQIGRLPDVYQRRADLERAILEKALAGDPEPVPALLDELRDLEPLAADLASLPGSGAVKVRRAAVLGKGESP